MLLHVNQHFIAYHALINQVQLLFTKPQLSTLALTLIWTQNLNTNFDTNLLETIWLPLSLLLPTAEKFLNYFECADKVRFLLDLVPL